VVKLANAKYDSFGVLVIHNEDLEAFAYRQLSDYKKGYFKEPHPLDADDFVENYLGIKVGYHALSLNGSLYGATALADGLLPILDSRGEVSLRETKKGQAFVDCEACRNCETTIRFTLVHESGHSQFDGNVDLKRLRMADSLTDTYADLFGQSAMRGKRTPTRMDGTPREPLCGLPAHAEEVRPQTVGETPQRLFLREADNLFQPKAPLARDQRNRQGPLRCKVLNRAPSSRIGPHLP